MLLLLLLCKFQTAAHFYILFFGALCEKAGIRVWEWKRELPQWQSHGRRRWTVCDLNNWKCSIKSVAHNVIAWASSTLPMMSYLARVIKISSRFSNHTQSTFIYFHFPSSVESRLPSSSSSSVIENENYNFHLKAYRFSKPTIVECKLKKIGSLLSI